MSATAVYTPASHHTPDGVRKPRRVVTAEYLVEIVLYKATYNAVLPDVPGCVATSTDLNEVKALIKEGLRLHLEFLLEEGQELPEVRTTSSTEDLFDPEEELVEAAYVKVELELPE